MVETIDPTTVLIAGVPLVVIIGVVVEIIKNIFTNLNTRWLPLISGILGIAICVWGGINQATLIEEIVIGLIAGLAASGSFDLGKKTILNK